ncbi:hypothetical protein [Pseudomonas sp. LTJR-52]|uniref:hypothetical protein n=1 Tax=Pseudomonas sp. LTJR-52 TaxID=2479392 RepID=UPI0013CEE237|nr:hypothetical protein [Pseudomonas sp. LTJR-52]
MDWLLLLCIGWGGGNTLAVQYGAVVRNGLLILWHPARHYRAQVSLALTGTALI